MSEKSWSGKTEGSSTSFRLLNSTLKRLNIRVVYAVLPFVVFYFLIFKKSRAMHIYRYLRRRQGYSIFGSLIGTYKNHLLFAKNFIDRFYVFAGKRERFKFSQQQVDRFKELVSVDKPVIILSAHIGNFEIASYIGGKIEREIKVIAFGQENSQIQQFRNEAMEVNNIQMIEVSDEMSHIFKISDAFREGAAITQTADRVFTGNKSAQINLFGAKAHFPLGIYYLAQIYGAKVITMFVMRSQKSFNYDLIINELNIQSESKNKHDIALEYSKAFVGALEATLLKYPLQWFNYYNFWEENR